MLFAGLLITHPGRNPRRRLDGHDPGPGQDIDVRARDQIAEGVECREFRLGRTKIALAESQHAPRAPTGTRSRAVGAAKWKSGIAAFIALSTEESACGGGG